MRERILEIPIKPHYELIKFIFEEEMLRELKHVKFYERVKKAFRQCGFSPSALSPLEDQKQLNVLFKDVELAETHCFENLKCQYQKLSPTMLVSELNDVLADAQANSESSVLFRSIPQGSKATHPVFYLVLKIAADAIECEKSLTVYPCINEKLLLISTQICPFDTLLGHITAYLEFLNTAPFFRSELKINNQLNRKSPMPLDNAFTDENNLRSKEYTQNVIFLMHLQAAKVYCQHFTTDIYYQQMQLKDDSFTALGDFLITSCERVSNETSKFTPAFLNMCCPLLLEISHEYVRKYASYERLAELLVVIKKIEIKTHLPNPMLNPNSPALNSSISVPVSDATSLSNKVDMPALENSTVFNQEIKNLAMHHLDNFLKDNWNPIKKHYYKGLKNLICTQGLSAQLLQDFLSAKNNGALFWKPFAKNETSKSCQCFAQLYRLASGMVLSETDKANMVRHKTLTAAAYPDDCFSCHAALKKDTASYFSENADILSIIAKRNKPYLKPNSPKATEALPKATAAIVEATSCELFTSTASTSIFYSPKQPSCPLVSPINALDLDEIDPKKRSNCSCM